MGITRQTWEKKVAPGEAVTVVDLLTLAREKRNKASISRFSSFLSCMVRRGEATKIKEPSDRVIHYQKAGGQKQTKPRPRKDPPAQEFNLLQLGESILAVIDSHKKHIRALRDDIKQLNSDIKCLVKQKRDLEELYTQAQQKILVLNSGKGKTINLHELQAIRDGLPANGKSSA